MNRFIQFQYKDKPIPLNIESQTTSTLSLNETLESVVSQFDQLVPFIEKAKQLHSRPAEQNLTEDELAAIYLYTDNCEGQSLHAALNQALQSGDPALIKPWLNFLKLLYNALGKVPSMKSTVWRGLPSNLVEQLKENDEIVCCGITSCSTSADVIRAIDQNSILCSIKPLNGKNIHEYSSLTGDYEVLLLPNTHLIVKSKKLDMDTGKSIVYLEEISDITEEQMASPHESVYDEETGEFVWIIFLLVDMSIIDEDEQQMKTEAVITFIHGDRYRLNYEHGTKRGHGEYDSTDGNQFRNETADEKATGEGICTFSNGDRFLGTFEQGLKNGHGILYEKDGLIRTGIWLNDRLSEQGLQKLSKGEAYPWADRHNSGRWYGVFDDGNGNKYIGNIRDGKADRLGIRFWSDGSRYEGHFKNNNKHGYGIYYYTEKDKYAGQWVNDEIEGQGKLSWSSGTCYSGDFINGKRHGEGSLTFANGKVLEGKWNDGAYLGEMMC